MLPPISYNEFEIIISDESPYDPRPDAAPSQREFLFGAEVSRHSSGHRVTVMHHHGAIHTSCLLVAGGGTTGVHGLSALINQDLCYLAVGPFVCALKLPDLQLCWNTRVDQSTCFGIYDAPNYKSIISHGELEIARLSYDGQLLWSAGGADIFTEGFELHKDYVLAVDFYGGRYKFDLETGSATDRPT